MKIESLAPVIVVDAIEPCLHFWTDRLGFAVAHEVRDGERLGFVMLTRDGVTVMYQTRASVAADLPVLAPPAGQRCTTPLYISVSDIDAVDRALEGAERPAARRRTFYGATEVFAREPGGALVCFAQHD